MAPTDVPQAHAAVRRENGTGGVATLILDQPGPVNTISLGFLEEMAAFVAALQADPSVRAIVVISGKKDSFIAGANLEMLGAIQTAADGAAFSRHGRELLATIERSPKPWVAAVHGACLGGGLETILPMRYRVASEESVTQLGQPEVQVGLLPGGGGTQRLPRLIGIQAGLDMVLTGKSVGARKALKLGLVNEVVPKAILREVAERRAAELADGKLQASASARPSGSALTRLALEDNPVGRRLLFRQAKRMLLARTHGNYPAPERTLEAVRVGFEKGMAAGYEEESLGFGDLCASPESKELIGLFFAQGALRKDSGVEDGAKPRPIDQLTVLGGGLMGAGISFVSMQAGMRVRLRDTDDAAVGRARAQVRGLIDERVQRKRVTPMEAAQVMSRLTTALDYSGMSRTGLFIEAVFENLQLKRRVLREVEAVAHPEAIFASNTSSLPIAQIAAEAKRPENVIGMHYFSPVNRMPLLEVIRHARSSSVAVATAVAVGKRQGKNVIVVNDGPGFYTTRILAPYIGEAGFLLEAGASVEEIDAALVGWGFPVGPLQLLDEVGIDVADKIAHVLGQAFGSRLAPPASFGKLIQDKRLGRKNKRGFYLYEGKKKRVDPSVYTALGLRPHDKAVLSVEIAERLSLAMINEAAHCLGEGILRSARDGDLGAIFGLGFPPFRGGPFRAVDARGAKAVVAKLEALLRRLGERFAPAPLLVTQAREATRFYS